MAVSQKLVVAVMVSLLHPRPVLVSSSARLRNTEEQIEEISRSLVTDFNPEEGSISCHSDIQWTALEVHLTQFSNSILILRRVDQLSQATQLQLGYALMHSNSAIKKALSSSAIILTTKASAEKLHPFLRRQILVKQEVDSVDDESAMVELPRMGSRVDLDQTLMTLRESIAKVVIIPELLRYVQDILMFVRTHRLARVGISTQASEDFLKLVRTLCVLEGRSFATPVSIRMAAKLALPVHVRLCAPEDEPSLQYGGDISTVKAWIKEWDGDVLVDSVLEEVPVPR